MTTGKITKRAVDGLAAGETLWDTEVRGFGVRRQRRDAAYILKYRVDGRQRFYTIGLHGAPWTPDTARGEAKRLLGLVNSNEAPRDPARERDLTRSQPTLAEFAERYIDDYANAHKKPRTVEEDQRNLKLHILPALGQRKMPDITRADVAKMQAARSKHPVNANRCLATLSHMFSKAEEWGIRKQGSNPCLGVTRYPEKNRERTLTPDELARLGDALERASRGVSEAEWNALSDEERKGRRRTPEDWRAIACYRLLLLTGARLSEILSLRWSYIDWERGVARLPDSKTGAKNLILPGPALAILTDLARTDSEFVLWRNATDPQKDDHTIPDNGTSEPDSAPDQHFIGIQKPWQRIRALAGLPDLRIHDLRHAYASIAVGSGDSLFLVGKVLGHRQASTTERYAHMQPDPVSAVATRTANRIATMLKGTTAD